MTIEEIRLLTQEELAEYLGLSKPTLQRWRREGYGPKYLRIGKHVYYKEVDVLAWIEEQRETQS